MVWDAAETRVAWSMSAGDESRLLLLREIDVYCGGGGDDWAGGFTDSVGVATRYDLTVPPGREAKKH